jgi:hypothetical protein
MQTYWILDRLFTNRQQPNFIFNSTANWMRALTILLDDKQFTDVELAKHFSSRVSRRPVNQQADTLVFENILMAFHNLAALNALKEQGGNKYDIVRVAVITWYYCVYFASQAMIAANSGAKTETHTTTAKVWHSDFIQSNLLISPFSICINGLVAKDVKVAVASLRGNNVFTINGAVPKTRDEAWGAFVSYLNGTVDHEAEKVENKVRRDNAFKALGVSDFRSQKAKELRDKALQKGFVNFLTQCFRYRGKANYRDSVFLCYGANYTSRIEQLMDDLVIVAEKYFKMTTHYIVLRTEKGTWEHFVNDLEKNSRLSKAIDILKL